MPKYLCRVEGHRDHICGLLLFLLQSAIEPLALYHPLCFLICVCSLWCFTDDPYVDRTYICNLELHQNGDGFRVSKTDFSTCPHPTPFQTHTYTHTHTHTHIHTHTHTHVRHCPTSAFFSTDHSKALLQFFFVRLWFKMRHLFCPYLFLISPSFDVSEGVCFVIVTFLGYFHLYCIWKLCPIIVAILGYCYIYFCNCLQQGVI